VVGTALRVDAVAVIMLSFRFLITVPGHQNTSVTGDPGNVTGACVESDLRVLRLG
jgi:hypothetical protein